MSATGLDIFDKTLQITSIWLGEIERDIGPDRQLAWKVLGSVLHTLRDRLPVNVAAHLGSQLPLLVRGAYYDQYQPARQPTDCNTVAQFAAEVAEGLSAVRRVDPKVAMGAVFALLSRHLPQGQIDKVQNVLPEPLRRSWQEIETGMKAMGQDIAGEDPVDRASAQSFPASDPPGWSGMTAGSPARTNRLEDAEPSPAISRRRS